MDISFYCFLWRLISVRRVRASNGRQNRFLYRSHRNGQSRKNIVFMRLCGVSGIHFLRRGEQIILLFFISRYCCIRFVCLGFFGGHGNSFCIFPGMPLAVAPHGSVSASSFAGKNRVATSLVLGLRKNLR